ncbi:hypothetical protein N8A98_04185 [Devosia neptuniae]|uniref:Uncharacterized protein n=1 Tax=Devosia neptuniae TaxID=191302 RepID=A0ABY6CF16_9HYPH|nr:hypothetical protein [Devosia neptuniae]UXN70403.1 hypothetical protein N8A98_04185 [Devosia neptuniae]
MSKQPSSRGGTTKVRFMLLEAEGAESDLTQIFSAIQSAVKPSTTIIQQRLTAAPVEQMLVSDGTDGSLVEEYADDDLVEVDKPQRNKPKASRKPTTPEVLDLDFDADVSLKSFADIHNAIDSDVDRYLVIAAWFKEHRDTSAVTTAHIYTGYRTLEWPAGIEDFGSVLRYLKSQKLMASGNRGEYAINHLGLAKVKKLASGG